jgi:hypothetical protein
MKTQEKSKLQKSIFQLIWIYPLGILFGFMDYVFRSSLSIEMEINLLDWKIHKPEVKKNYTSIAWATPFNTALTTVSLAKSEHYLSLPKEKRKSFSMANVKTLYHNKLLINRFFSVLGIDSNTHLNNPKIKELYYFGSIAA